MTPDINGLEKLIGALSGAFLALVFMLPRSWGDFLRRSSASIVSGIVFASTFREWMEWADTMDNLVAAACASGFLSWIVMSSAVETWKKVAKRK